jgi:hypothetical protein
MCWLSTSAGCVDTGVAYASQQGKHRPCVSLPAGVLVGCYESTRFKSKSKPLKLQGVDLLGLGAGAAGADEASVKAGAAVAAGNFLTRSVIWAVGGGACMGGGGAGVLEL